MPEDAGKATKKTTLLAITSLAALIASLFSTAVNVALPSIGNQFSLDAGTLGWITTSFILATAVSMIQLGRLGDIYGRKRLFSTGLWLFIIASLLCAASTSAELLITFRVIQGIGAAMIWSPGMALLTSAFPVNERGKAIGINTASVYVGLSLGPFWGGLLTQNIGWQSIFYISIIPMIVMIIVTYLKLRGDWAESRGEKFDILGSLTLAVSLGLFMYGFSLIPKTASLPIVILGLLGLLFFIYLESRTANPVLDLGLFKNNRPFTFALLAVVLQYSATFGSLFLMSLFLQYNKGYSPQVAGSILVIQPAVMAMVAPLSGRLSDRMEPLKVAAMGMGLTCVAQFLLALTTGTTSIWAIAGMLALLGIGFGSFSSPTTNAAISSVNRKYFGVVSGSVSAVRHGGQVISMAIIIILFTVYIGDSQITPEYYPAFLTSFKTAFLIFGIICLSGVFVLLAGGRVRQSQSTAINGL